MSLRTLGALLQKRLNADRRRNPVPRAHASASRTAHTQAILLSARGAQKHTAFQFHGEPARRVRQAELRLRVQLPAETRAAGASHRGAHRAAAQHRRGRGARVGGP
ncbi:hypothetical protein GGI05_007320 [Coemansia sp. RSA 2603]|nr:hypothetical protein GGI05_007320 [Coemansia sp. RSA 2603]